MTTQTTNNSIIGRSGNFFGRQLGGGNTGRSVVGMLVLLAAMFFAAENSFAQNGCISLLGQTSGNCKPTPPAAQTTNLYYQNGGAYYGKVTAYQGSFYHIHSINGGVEIKTFANSCKPATSGGVAGYVCSFAQFKDGRQTYSGWGYFFQNGMVYLYWKYEFLPYQRQIDIGWYAFRP